MIWFMMFLVFSVALCEKLHNPILKCCRNGEELHSNGRDCVRRPEHNIQIMEDDKYVDFGDPSQLKQNPYWLPPAVLNKLPPRNLFVKYRNRDLCRSQYFVLLNTNNTDRYTIRGNYTLSVDFTYIDGNTFNVEFVNTEYCLDSLSRPRGSHVFRLCTYGEKNVTTVRKCCKFGQRIQLKDSVVSCKDAVNSTWSVQDSVSRSYLPNTTVTDVMDGSTSLCSSGEFKTVQPNEASKFVSGSLDLYESEFNLYQYKCFDSLFGEFRENETVGFCHHRIENLGAYYFVFWHSPVLAAIALAVGLIILGSRSDIYKNVNGKALLCHILTLCIGHVLYIEWQYNFKKWSEILVLALNFFIMSSVLWLNAICFNMARGLGAPLETRKSRNRWASFAWYSLYVWGGSSFHTVLLATQPWRKHGGRDIILYAYHTKTSLNVDEWRTSLNLEALFFGYGPVGTLLIINICFVTTAILKIRKLERDTSILYRRLSVRITNKKKPLKYVRLLLTTGIGEMALEIAALATRFPPTYNDDGSRLMDDEIWIVRLVQKEVLFRILAAVCDLLRAFSVLALCCANDSGVFRSIRAGSQRIRSSVATCCGQNDTDCETDICTGNA